MTAVQRTEESMDFYCKILINERIFTARMLIKLCPILCDPYELQPARLLCPMGFSRQECRSGLPSPPPGDLPNPMFEPESPVALALQADSLPLSNVRMFCKSQELPLKTGITINLKRDRMLKNNQNEGRKERSTRDNRKEQDVKFKDKYINDYINQKRLLEQTKSKTQVDALYKSCIKYKDGLK